jgi:hypothetical protein
MECVRCPTKAYLVVAADVRRLYPIWEFSFAVPEGEAGSQPHYFGCYARFNDSTL